MNAPIPRLALALLPALAPALFLAPSARADDHRGHVLLQAYTSRCGSLSEPGATETCVYLFIDEVDGRIDLSLPSDATLTLERNGTPLTAFSDVPVATVLSAPQIAALYQPASEARRLAATMTALDGALADDAPITAATFAARLHDAVSAFAGEALPPHPVPPFDPAERAIVADLQLRTFVDLAARVDPNVAVARRRGFIDRTPPTLGAPLIVDAGDPSTEVEVPVGFVYYRLVAKDSFGREADLGRVMVSLAPHRLPAPAGFADVSSDQSRCDAPEQGRSHGVVALTWTHPGANISERQAHQQNTTGYDLWRADGRCTDPGTVDLAALVANADASGPDGRPLVAGYQQVNDVPILIREPPASGREAERSGWNPAFSQWTDDAAALAAAGFVPGDHVCYYVVGLDRTGNYGATAGLAALVPDSLEPVAPWDVAAVPDSDPTADVSPVAPDVYNTTVTTDDSFALEWSAVDVRNWVSRRADGRAACNAVEAESSGRLLVAPTVEGCRNGSELNLDVASYVVYRFTSPDEAGRFVDSDGDGYADSDEGTSTATPGTSCNAAVHGGGVDHRAEGQLEVVRRADGSALVRWRDRSNDGPVANKGTVYWYRVATRGANGKVSAPSAPVRGVFFDKTKPDRFRLDEVRFGACGPDVYASEAPDVDRFALDTTLEAAELRVLCLPHEEVPWLVPPPGRFVDRIRGWVATYPYTQVSPIEGDLSQGREVIAPRDLLCAAAFSGCDLVAEVVDPRGRVIGEAAIPDEQGCAFTVESHESCDAGFVPAQPGAVFDKPLRLDLPLAAGECAGVFGTIGDERFRLGTLCGPANKTMIVPLPELGPTFTCLSVTRYSEGGRVPSTDTNLPCVTVQPPAAVPPPPRLASLVLPADQALATLTWYGPDQNIAGIITERWERTSNARTSEFLPAESLQGASAAHASPLGLPGVLAAGQEEEWCVRAQAVSAATPADMGGKLSEWTGPICGLRRHAPSNPSLPEYLAWPSMPVPKKLGDDLVLESFRTDGLLVVQLATIAPGNIEMPHGIPDSEIEAEKCENACGCPPAPCEPDNAPCLCTYNGDCGASQPIGTLSCNLCHEVWKAMGEHVRIIAYRQSRTEDPDGSGPLQRDVGPWVQASPMLANVFCSLDLYRANNEAAGQKVWDPYFAMLAFAAPGAPANEREYRLYFTDRLPHEVENGYRFQFVYFDEDGDPIGYRETNWLEIAP